MRDRIIVDKIYARASARIGRNQKKDLKSMKRQLNGKGVEHHVQSERRDSRGVSGGFLPTPASLKFLIKI